MRSNPKICIIGGGNIGMALAVELKQNIEARIVLLTSKASLFSKKIISLDSLTKEELSCELDLITDNFQEALYNMDLCFIAVPAFCLADIINMFKRIELNKSMIICFVPGTGGKEFYCQDLIEQGHTVIGMDRVPFIARIFEEGKSVVVSKKTQIRFATLGKDDKTGIASLLCKVLNMECLPLKNYLAVTLTPSNPLLHTSRLYSLFCSKTQSSVFDEQIKFYAGWDDIASSYLLNADNELQMICRAYQTIDLSEVIPLRKHYESNSVRDLTNKMRSIKSLSYIDAPLIYNDGKYVIDAKSRYFREDFPFGLCVIKSFAVIAGISTPLVDKILRWFEHFFNVTYFIDNEFIGKDLNLLPLPQNFGINTVDAVVNFYTHAQGQGEETNRG